MKRPSSVWLCSTVAAVALLAGARDVLAQSAAEQPDSASSSPAAQTSDIVLLKNGGMVRGVIIELVPSVSVVIQLPTGESRTYAMTEVEYAGPASRIPNQPASAPESTAPAAPTSTSDPITVFRDKVRIRLTSSQRDLSYYVETGTGSSRYTRLCTAPCEVELPVGEYTFALSSGAAPPTRVKNSIRVEDGLVLEANHRSKSSTRKAGWTVFGLGMGVGTTLMAIGVLIPKEQECSATTSGGACKTDSGNSLAFILGGAISSAIGLGLGLPTALTRDSVQLKPVVAPVASPVGAAQRGWAGGLTGMELVGSF